MKATWHRLLGPITRGVRVLLAILTVGYVAAMIGVFSRAYNLYDWLALSGPKFRQGHFWALLTYSLLPGSILDFIWNWVFILCVGAWLERAWSRSQLWILCCVAALGAGLAKVIIRPADPYLLVGTTPMIFGLLVAWSMQFGHEKVWFWWLWEMTVRQAALLFGAITTLLMLACPCVGPVNAAIMLFGGLTAWLYLRLQAWFLRMRRSRAVASDRIGRLEL